MRSKAGWAGRVGASAMLAIMGLAASACWAQEASERAPAQSFSLSRFAPGRVEAQLVVEASLKAGASAMNLGSLHATLASEPHMAGSDGDARVIEFIAAYFEQAGLEVHTQWIWPYLARPITAALEIVAPEQKSLNVTEPPVEGDPYSADPRLNIGFNALSANGEVVAGVVYANFGRKEDFERLAQLGVDVSGKIAIARYGGNFRGFKVKYAQEAGAAGLIIYTDPAESGYMRGLLYPEGGWATDQQIQRGSITTLPWPGDPLTPMVVATENAERLDPESVALPRIPVQPVGWAAASEILSRMTGEGVPDGWQGALPFPYRLTGGPELKVRLMVQQERGLTKTANVVGTLRGAVYPDEWIIIGCHHDAWGFGAADPLAGTILVLEAARIFGEQARAGHRPDRSILFAAWAAEEYGIVGSVEWVEAHRQELLKNAVAYINLDMASMGPLLHANGAPALRRLILDAARQTPQAHEPEITAYDQWLTRSLAGAGGSDTNGPRVGSMGGGSDHIGFYFHVGAPTMSLAASGGRGTSYHSNYDNLHWYHKVVGDDYEPALMLARVLSVLVSRLANADALPLDPMGYGPDLRKHLDAIEQIAKEKQVPLDLATLRSGIGTLEVAAQAFDARLAAGIASGAIASAELARVNERVLRRLECVWLDDAGLPGRNWFKSLYMAPDETSGYSAWPLPALRKAIEDRDPDGAARAVAALNERVRALTQSLQSALATP